jgi:hypothetical protein
LLGALRLRQSALCKRATFDVDDGRVASLALREPRHRRQVFPPIPAFSDICRSQKLHIADSSGTPILSTTPDSPALTSLSQTLVTSNSALDHLGLGRVVGVHAQYTSCEVIQTAKLEGKTGVVATVVGKQANRSVEVKKIVNVVHGALNGDAGGEGGIAQGSMEGRRGEDGKIDRAASSSSAAVS